MSSQRFWPGQKDWELQRIANLRRCRFENLNRRPVLQKRFVLGSCSSFRSLNSVMKSQIACGFGELAWQVRSLGSESKAILLYCEN